MSDEGVDPLSQLWQALTEPQPPVQVVITAGTWIEYCLFQIVRHNLAYPAALGSDQDAGLSYTTLVRLAIAVGGVPADLKKGLVEFGHIRNRFAHEIRTLLTDADVDRLIDKLPPSLTELLRRRPQTWPRFQWLLMLLCQDLYRLKPEEEWAPVDEPRLVSQGALEMQDRAAYFEGFMEIIEDGERTSSGTLRLRLLPDPRNSH